MKYSLTQRLPPVQTPCEMTPTHRPFLNLRHLALSELGNSFIEPVFSDNSRLCQVDSKVNQEAQLLSSMGLRGQQENVRLLMKIETS